MRSTCSLRQEFLKKWIMGLGRCNYPKKDMSILERTKVIKLSADVAMASTRKGTTCWSQALVANAVKQGNDDEKNLVEQMLGPNPIGAMSCNKRNIIRFRRSKKIVKRSCGIRRRIRRKCGAQPAIRRSSIAKRLVEKRREILKKLIPGGELMNGVSFIEETLDYIISLRAQVDVMRCLASASELVNP